MNCPIWHKKGHTRYLRGPISQNSYQIQMSIMQGLEEGFQGFQNIRFFFDPPRLVHIECATLYDNAQIRRLSCVDSWVTQVTHEITWTNALSMNRLIQNHAVENGRSFICALHTHNKTYFLSIFGLLLHKQILFIT